MKKQNHPMPIWAQNTILYGPSGCGKTHHSASIASALGLTSVYDGVTLKEAVHLSKVRVCTLIITNDPDASLLSNSIHFKDAIVMVQAEEWNELS